MVAHKVKRRQRLLIFLVDFQRVFVSEVMASKDRRVNMSSSSDKEDYEESGRGVRRARSYRRQSPSSSL